MKVSLLHFVYYLFCLVIVVGMGSIRSSPVYGKLDFLLLDGRPWWKPWQPMITRILQQGDQPVLSDMMTSTVMRGVFGQKTLLFRFDRRYSIADVEVFSQLNAPSCSLVPVGALYLLLADEEKIIDKSSTGGMLSLKERMIRMLGDLAKLQRNNRKMAQNSLPFRCVINLRGFSPSWVASETGHWSKWFAYTSSLYRYHGIRGQRLEKLLRENPPQNCIVFFGH